MSQVINQAHQEHLAWAQRRLEALDKIEIKLKAMRSLAIYAASKTHSESETAQLQEWMNILQAEIHAIDQATAWFGENARGH